MVESFDDCTRKKEEIEILRKHILTCKELSGNSFAIKAALSALEKEVQRINRDQKLKEKFSKQKIRENKAEQNYLSEADTDVVDLKKEKELEHSEANQVDDSILTEWQDVHSPNAEVIPGSTYAESILGRKLAEAAISKIAAVDAKVLDDLSAIALVIHSALLSNLLNFKCTGIPEPEGKCNGFAKPIRELPKNKFIPDEFYNLENQNLVQLRYRKKETGSVLLKVSKIMSPDINISVEFSPSIAQPEPNPQGPLVFHLSDHLNLDSFYTALDSARKMNSNKSTRILPTLHYKSLSQLLTVFVKFFDVGPVNDASWESCENNSLKTEKFLAPAPNLSSPKSYVNAPSFSCSANRKSHTLQELRPPKVRGDFETDLNPSAPFDQPTILPQTGSLMGPNHPLFRRPFDDDEFNPCVDTDPLRPTLGGLGMQPRFDPFGPPGGPTNLREIGGRDRDGRRRNRARRMNGGDPNNDHQRPPNDFGHMFM